VEFQYWVWFLSGIRRESTVALISQSPWWGSGNSEGVADGSWATRLHTPGSQAVGGIRSKTVWQCQWSIGETSSLERLNRDPAKLHRIAVAGETEEAARPVFPWVG
jgi:hypothetical protein